MQRDFYKRLVSWKDSHDRKPLLIKGARQVGKTYLIRQFGMEEYENMVYLDFDQDPKLKEFFLKNLKPDRILIDLALYFEVKIEPGKTLIVFDEIQESPHALNSLKYFNENAKEHHVIAAGSFLGVTLNRTKGFPVGKVTFADLYPLSFLEFLTALGKHQLRSFLVNKKDPIAIADPIHEELISLLKYYYIIGGMPEAIKKYLLNPADLASVRKVQQDIINAYQLDFTKHVPTAEAIKILKVWSSIPTQITKENKKFMFSKIHKNARAREYTDAIEWLLKAGLILKSKMITSPKHPLEAYHQESIFKIFLLDVGLLGFMSGLSPKIILEGDKLFTEFKGAFTENFVAQELISKSHPLFYWSLDAKGEIDFVLIKDTELFPLEVKAGHSKNTKSLNIYLHKFSPRVLVRSSLRNFTQDDNFLNIPIYSVSHFDHYL